MNRFIIIQARMSSTRLFGKVMLPLCGKTVLEVMMDRLSGFKNNIIIATTNDGTEKPIIDLCKKLKLKFHKGDKENVLSRYYEAAVKYGAKEGDTIVRLTSDCPIIDQKIVIQIIEYFEKNGFDYVSNCLRRTYPRGLDVEVFNFDAMQKAYFQATDNFEKEHVTPFINDTHKDEFSIGHFTNKEDHSKYRLTLDEVDDYQAIQELYGRFRDKTSFSYKQLINMLEKFPYIYGINAHVEQKTYDDCTV